MNLLLETGTIVTDDEARQRWLAHLPATVVAVQEDDEWLPLYEGTDSTPEDFKWVTSAVGPIRIKDRAAHALKGAGFGIAMNSPKGKHWQKMDSGFTHHVQVNPNGHWLHLSRMERNGFGAERSMARGTDHKSLARHMDMSRLFQFRELPK